MSECTFRASGQCPWPNCCGSARENLPQEPDGISPEDRRHIGGGEPAIQQRCREGGQLVDLAKSLEFLDGALRNLLTT